MCTAYGAPASVIYTFGAEYGTILLPGNIAVPSGVTAYTCNGIDNNGILQLSPSLRGSRLIRPTSFKARLAKNIS